MGSERRQTTARSADARWLATFEDRYGAGSHQRLIDLLRQQCVTFAGIARQFSVTRERVRQWQMLLLPDAPRGHERQRLCGLYHQKLRLLQDSLFRSFYHHARPHFDAGRIGLIKAGDGYRTRSVRIDGRTVAIRDVSRSAEGRRSSSAPVYTLVYRGSAEFVYFRFTPDDYLFLPASELPRAGSIFSDSPASRYQAFKNTFTALEGGARSRLASSPRRSSASQKSTLQCARS